MIDNRILVVRFGDNDFGNSLVALGQHLLDEVGEEVVREIYEKNHDEFNEILTRLFRSMLILHQPRLDMFCRWGGKDKLFDKMDVYLADDYYILNDTQFISTYEHEGDNSETLVVDFINNQTFTVWSIKHLLS